MNLQNYIRARPFAYHLTAAMNLPNIRTQRHLSPAAHALESSDLSLTTKRTQHLLVTLAGFTRQIRDQAPLHPGNCDLIGAWTFARFVEELNQRVFFWPGTDQPISYGIRHFERYKGEKPVILRIDTAALFGANPGVTPDVCKYNSGSPRCSSGKKSPRGPATFTAMSTSSLRPSEVVELTFRGTVLLPSRTQFASTPSGPWRAL